MPITAGLIPRKIGSIFGKLPYLTKAIAMKLLRLIF